MKKVISKILSAVLAAAMAASFLPAYAAPSEEASDEAPHISESRVFLQNGMRAVLITPETDFEVSEDGGGAELSELMSEVSGYGMNTVIINSSLDGKAFFDAESGVCGVLTDACDAAREAGLYAYVALDVGLLADAVRENGGGLKDGFSAAAHKIVMRCGCDGILLDNYYTYDTPEAYAEYMRSGSGIGYTNWLYETNEYTVRTLSEVIRRTNNTLSVGMVISDMWANYTSDERGSQTADSVEALYDGFCDTKKYVENGYVDFTLVKAYGSTSDGALNFESVVSWWYDLAGLSGTKLYVMHLNDRIGQYNGWYEDQLLRQLYVMEEYPDIGGSAFSSLASLRADPLGTTGTLMKYFDDEINKQTLFEDLTMISPSSLNFVTYDNTVKFMGTFDENFDVKFDGEKIKLNEAGNFYFQKELDVGLNTFVIEHKGKEYHYSIDRRVDVLKSVSQENDIVVSGGTKLSFEAVAYSGSKVSVSIAGQTVNLKEKSGSGEELDANSSYAKFVGYYTVADGIVGEEQYLGNISFYAAFSGQEESMTGGSVTIEAKPVPPAPVAAEIVEDQSSVGSGEIVGTADPVISDSETVTYVRVINDYTTVYDGLTTGAIPSPLFCQLPAGTLDYLKSSSGGYVTTTSGKRFDADDVTTFTDTGLGYNALFVKAVGNSGGKSFIKLHLDYKSSFNVTAPVSFHDDIYGAYGVYDYDASVVYITFDNVTSVTSLPSFEYCSLFSGGKWETVEENGITKFRLALTLRQAGIYGGCGAYYDENGDLMLTFVVPTSSLAGKVIVIDPGHGYGKTPDKLDPGGIGNVTEQSVNLAVSKKLEEKLTAMGATVVRLKTESEFILTETRPTVARAYGADMYLSLHCNRVDNETAHGVEVYYFTPFSQPLAKAINDGLSSLFDNTFYADGTSSNRGAKYSYYWVTLQQDFPSVLVEMGFISNERECMIMADSANQDKMAQTIADGVYAYFARSGISYGGNGSDSADDPSGTGDIPVHETEEAPESGETAEASESAETYDHPESSETGGSYESAETEVLPEPTEEAPETEDTYDGSFGIRV